MSEAAPSRPEAAPGGATVASSPSVRVASAGDAAAVAAAIELLLDELGGARPPRQALEAATRQLAADPEAGALLVAEAGDEIVGVLAASWQLAIHVPGRYGTIQDLWVDPEWRSRAIGRDLVAALAVLARERGVARLEVGLPQEGFAMLEATRAFYLGNGFEPLGPRLRMVLK